MSALSLWMNGERVGTWTQTRAGVHRLDYERAWFESERGRPLSLSLPFTATLDVQGSQVLNFFDNLLPDNETIRDRVQRRYALPDAGVMTLLGAIGRDCVGAIQLLGENDEPPAQCALTFDALDEAGVARALREASSAPGALDYGDEFEDFRVSLAGAQEKTALLRVGDAWCLPRGATPTTHILKLPLGIVGGEQREGGYDMRLSVENEWVCLRLMRAFGLLTASADIATFEDRKVLVVERFDRLWMDGGRWIARLPQEDFCQATGTSWRNKYEGRPEPGAGRATAPGIRQCLEILAGSTNAEADQASFAMCQFVFWLLAATDGHAKNFSLFIGRGGEISITPFYDVISMWPTIGPGKNLNTTRRGVALAMALRGRNPHRRLIDIMPRHWRGLAQQAGQPHLFKRMLDLAETVVPRLEVVQAELPVGFPEAMWDTIRRGVAYQARRFLDLVRNEP